MKKSVLPLFVLFVSVIALSLLMPSRASAQKKGGKSTAPETYMVVKIGEKYKVVATSRYKDEEKKIKDDYDEKVKEWQDARKSDPTAPHPVKPLIKKIKTGYQTQVKAQEYADKLTDEGADKDNPKKK